MDRDRKEAILFFIAFSMTNGDARFRNDQGTR